MRQTAAKGANIHRLQRQCDRPNLIVVRAVPPFAYSNGVNDASVLTCHCWSLLTTI